MSCQQLTRFNRATRFLVHTASIDPADEIAGHRPVRVHCILVLVVAFITISFLQPLQAKDETSQPQDLASILHKIKQLEAKFAAAHLKVRKLEEQLAKSKEAALSARLERARERTEKNEQGVELIKLKINAKLLDSEASQLRDELQAARNKIESLQGGLATGVDQSGQSEAARAALHEAETQIASHKAAADAARSEAAALKLKLQAANTTLETIGLEADLGAELTNLKAELTEARRVAEQHKTRLAELQTSYKKAVDELDELRAASKQPDKADDSQTVLQQADARIAKLQQQVDASKAKALTATRKLDETGANLDELVAERDKTLSEVAKLKQDLAKANRKDQTRPADQTKLAEVELARDAAVRGLDKAKQSVQALQSDVDALRKASNDTNQKIATLKARLKDAEASATKADRLQAAVQKAQAEADNLAKASENSGAEAAAARSELQEMVMMLKTMTADKVSALSEVSALNVSLAVAVREAEQKQTKLSELAASSEQARAAAIGEFAKSSAMVKAKDKNLRDAVDELARVKGQLRTANEKVETTSAEAYVLRETLAERKRQLAELKSTLTAALGEVRQARNEISKRIDRMIDVAVAPQSTEIADLRAKLKAARAEIERLKASQPNKSASGG